ncbi:MAG: F-type +-transporting ATPase subunit a [Candidatus Peribacteria bacterium]|nr:F-type +-transporting ATPase subunit a [Candidatus Peribacteria bacterium]
MATITAPSLASETIAHIGQFEVRNTLLMAWMAMAVLIGFALVARSTGYKLIPGRLQAFAEIIVETLYDFFDSILQDNALTRRIFAMSATFFLFIVVGNWMGIFPGVGSITIQGMHEGHETAIPLFRSMNADANVTLAFSLISVIVTQVLGIASLGIFTHARKYIVAPWKSPVGFFVGLLEFVGEFARLISFVFRLFGNIFAGEVLLVVVSFLVPYIVPIPFLGLEVFVGFIQALVFTMLTLSFIKMSVTHHGEHDEKHGTAEHGDIPPQIHGAPA